MTEVPNNFTQLTSPNATEDDQNATFASTHSDDKRSRDSADEVAESTRPIDQPAPKRARLTRKNLKVHTTDLKEAETISLLQGQSESGSSETSLAPNFATQLFDNGVVPKWHGSGRQLDDMDAIVARLGQTRGSPPPSPVTFERFTRKQDANPNRRKVMGRLWPFLAKDPMQRAGMEYDEYLDHTWDQADNLLITRGLESAKPDVLEAFTFRSFRVSYCDAMEQIPSLSPVSGQPFTMPHFVCHGVHQGRSRHDAGLQCAYYGALMVDNAIRVYQWAGQDLDSCLGKAHAISVAFGDNGLQIFAHYSARISPEDKEQARTLVPDLPETQYHQALIYASRLDDLEAFEKAYTRVRNAQDIGYDLASTLRRKVHDHVIAQGRARKQSIEHGLKA